VVSSKSTGATKTTAKGQKKFYIRACSPKGFVKEQPEITGGGRIGKKRRKSVPSQISRSWVFRKSNEPRMPSRDKYRRAESSKTPGRDISGKKAVPSLTKTGSRTHLRGTNSLLFGVGSQQRIYRKERGPALGLKKHLAYPGEIQRTLRGYQKKKKVELLNKDLTVGRDLSNNHREKIPLLASPLSLWFGDRTHTFLM